MAKRIKLAHGDVFTVSLREGLLGFGQIFGGGLVFHISLFARTASSPSELDAALASEITVCGWTTDAGFYRGEWSVIGNYPVDENKIPKPASKVGMDGEWWVQDWTGQPIRPATSEEVDTLENHTSASPGLFVDALRAILGIEPWQYAVPIEKYSATYRRQMAEQVRI